MTSNAKVHRENTETLDRMQKQHATEKARREKETAVLNREYGIKPPKYDPPAKGRQSR